MTAATTIEIGRWGTRHTTRRWAGKTIALADDIAHRIAERDGTVSVAFSTVRFVWMPEVKP